MNLDSDDWFSSHGNAARERIEQELEAMGDFAHYLLLMSDFLRAAKAQGIFTNTRGSAANSLLCYCLEIHEYDSIEYGLTFERFFSTTRKKPPDIDIDIEQDRYEDFINNIVIPRMEELEGEGQVVQISSYGTAANRSAFRMAASALGISKEKQDEISKLLPQIIDSGIAEEESTAFEVLKDDYPELYHLTSGIFDSIKSVGQHPCGWLLGTKERPIEEWVPLYLIASSNSLVTQFDMDTLSELGWLKGDFLRLKALSVAKRTIRSAGLDIPLHEIPLDDEPTYEMIREGRTEGVHTLQGRENRRGAIECEVRNVFDVMNVVALYRPAHTSLGTDKLYNQRRLGHEVVTYEHPIVEEILSDTQGIPIFQEQVMEICKAVGMDAAGVDLVYESIKKAKGAGRHAKEAFAKVKPKFFKAALKTIDNEVTVEEIWQTYIQGSTGYGFNKGHATSYSAFPVRMAYLKCNYPEHFWASSTVCLPGAHALHRWRSLRGLQAVATFREHFGWGLYA